MEEKLDSKSWGFYTATKETGSSAEERFTADGSLLSKTLNQTGEVG